MHFKSTLLATSIVALCGSALVHGASETTAAPTPEQTCLAACAKGDVMCEAQCAGTAHPNPDQANATIMCIRNQCNQGDGSAEATAKYSACEQECIANNFPTNQSVVGTVIVPTASGEAYTASSTIMPITTPTSGSGSGSGSGGSRSGGSRSGGSSAGGSGSGTGTGSGSPTAAGSGSPAGASTNSDSNSAGSNTKTGASFAAIAAILVAVFAL